MTIVGEPLDFLRKGVIQGFAGSWQSGIATLIFDNDQCFCENGPTVRALENCFGNVIGENHSVRTDGDHVGKEVYYSVDAFNVLVAFTPVDDAPQEMHDYYEAQEVKDNGFDSGDL